MILPPTIPIFPLPNVVLFPNVFLPLHIFESRYREMVKDALASDRIIGMVLLQPGYEANYEGRPPVYPVGCAGVITHSEPLPDGRFNIVLHGSNRFRVMLSEDEYARLVKYIRHKQATSPMWHAALYNCNLWTGEIAQYLGLKTGFHWLPPADYIQKIKEMNAERVQQAAVWASDVTTNSATVR